ncbi:MAG: hypothetical protein LBS58_02110, partial [Coriobacteriales bacterium]|nr:hypothetical protein [Coriobacteriales bacterium]
MSYVPAMFPANDLVQHLGNARAFLLGGVAFGAIMCALMPKRLEAPGRQAFLLAGLIGSIATACVALSPHYPLQVAPAVGAGGLYAAGAICGCFLIAFLHRLTQEESMSAAVWAVALALLLKIALASIISTLAPAALQIALTLVIMPVMTVLLLVTHGMRMPQKGEGGAAAKGEAPAGEASSGTPLHRQPLFIILLLSCVLRAMVRSFGPMGFYGRATAAGNIISPPDFLILLLFVVAFVIFIPIRQRNTNPAVRFLPALLIILAGLALLDPELKAFFNINDWAIGLIYHFCEFATHLFFWIIIAVAMRGLPLHFNRIGGIALATYALASLTLLIALQFVENIGFLVIVGAIYFFFIMLVLAFRVGNAATAPAGDEDVRNLLDSEKAHYLALASSCNLSPRET